MRILLLFLALACAASAQTFTPNLQMQLPAHGQSNWDNVVNANFSVLDQAYGTITQPFMGAWSSAAVYLRGQTVTYLGVLYISLANFNQNNVPATSALFWFPYITITPSSCNANTVFAGPSSGSPVAPTCRALVSADVPALSSLSGTLAASQGGTGSAATPTAGQVPAGNAGGTAYAPVTISGDATLSSVGALVVTKTNGSVFAASATSDTTVASNITSGTLSASRLPATVVQTNQGNAYTSGTQDFSGAGDVKGRVFTGLTTTANGEFGFDSTNGVWHFWQNSGVGADWSPVMIPVSSISAAGNGDCFTVSHPNSGFVGASDAGAPCVTGNTAYLTGNYTNSTTTFSNVTGLSFSVAANTNYKIRCDLDYQTSATTADVKIQWTGPASPTAVTYDLVAQVTGSSLSSSVATAFSTSLSESGTPTTATNFPLTLTLTLINGANSGTVQLQAAANGTGTITIIPGSCILQR